VAGGVSSWLLYKGQVKSYANKPLFGLVSFLRFALISLLCFLLLSPILRYVKQNEEKPTILFVQDNSASEKHAFKKIDSIAYRKNVEQLLDQLKQDYTVKTYSLGNTLSDSFKFKYNEESTDLSSALEILLSTHENENLGAILLASDGIYNKGMSPLSVQYPFKGSIYTIGLGDTTLQKDALVARAFANKVVYLGDQFVIRADVSAYGCKGQNFTLSIFNHNSNKVVASQNFNALDERASKSIELVLDAKVAGLQHYTVSISKAEGEQNIANNAQDLYVEVLDNKESILILANAPHPDVFALKEALTKNKNYKVEVSTANSFKGQVADYNLVILHNLPSAGYNATSVIDNAKKSGISLWFIVGAQTAIPLYNKAQNCVTIQARGTSTNDVQAILQTEFSYFSLPANTSLKALPPLSAPFGDFTNGPSTQVLMKQQIGSVTTNYPLWIVQQGSGGKTGVLAGEGIWRWRMYDFNQHKNHNLVDEYILKTAQFLAVKQDKRPFRTALSKSIFDESEPIVLDAELYNENVELINIPDVTVSLLDENKSKSTFTMNKESNSYSLNMGNLAAGNYSYNATTSWNGKTYSSSGNFRVTALNIEEVNTSADFGMLNELAKSYQGEFVFAQAVQSLRDKIKSNPNIKTLLRSQVNSEPLINWKWLFGALILFLSLEWFVRKRNGNY
jgi:hypothetical protein